MKSGAAGNRLRRPLEAQRTARALESEKKAREGAADTETQRVSLESRLADAQRIIDSLIERVGKPLRKKP